MKLTLNRTTTARVDVDVELPIYRKHDVSGDDYETVIYTKVCDRPEGTVEIDVTIRENYTGTREVSIEFDTFRPLGDTESYKLGLGQYACTEAEFDAAVATARQMLASLEPGA